MYAHSSSVETVAYSLSSKEHNLFTMVHNHGNSAKPTRRKPGKMRDQGTKVKKELRFTGGRENQTLMSNSKMT